MKNTLKIISTTMLISSLSTSALAETNIGENTYEETTLLYTEQNTLADNQENNLNPYNDTEQIINSGLERSKSYNLSLIDGTWNKEGDKLQIDGTVKIETPSGDFLVSEDEILYRNKDNIYSIDDNGDMIVSEDSSSKFDNADNQEAVEEVNQIQDFIPSNIPNENTDSKGFEATLNDEGITLTNNNNTMNIDNNEKLDIDDSSIVLDENIVGEKNNTNLINEFSLKNNLDDLTKDTNISTVPIIESNTDILNETDAANQDEQTNIPPTESNVIDTKTIEKQNEKILEIDKKAENIANETQELKNDILNNKDEEQKVNTDFPQTPTNDTNKSLEDEKQNGKILEVDEKTEIIAKETQELKANFLKLEEREKVASSVTIPKPTDILPIKTETDKETESATVNTQNTKKDIVSPKKEQDTTPTKNTVTKNIDIKPNNSNIVKEQSTVEGEGIANLNSQDVGNLQVVANPDTEKIDSDIFVEVAKTNNPDETLTYCLSPETDFQNGQPLNSGDYFVKDIYFANNELDDAYSFSYNDVIKSLKGQTTYLRIQVAKNDNGKLSSSLSEDINTSDLVPNDLNGSIEGNENNLASPDSHKNSFSFINVIFLLVAALGGIFLIERKFNISKRLIHRDFRSPRPRKR